MAQALQIRPVRRGDTPYLHQIVSEVFIEYGMTLDLTGFDRDLVLPQEHYKEPNATFCVADLNGEILGMVGCHLEKDHAVLHRLYLSPRARGRGLGKLLCIDMENWAKSPDRRSPVQTMKLWSDVRLTHAHAMYRSMGYQIFGSRILEDPDRSVEFGMQRNLSTPISASPSALTDVLTSKTEQVSHNLWSKDSGLVRKALFAAASILDARKLATSVNHDHGKFPVLPPIESLFAGAKTPEISLVLADHDTVLGFTWGHETFWHPSCK